MKNLVLRFINDTEGQDLIEYALLAALVALGAVAGMQALAGGINGKFSAVSTSLNGSRVDKSAPTTIANDRLESPCPARNSTPKIDENQCGSSDMMKSQPTIPMTSA